MVIILTEISKNFKLKLLGEILSPESSISSAGRRGLCLLSMCSSLRESSKVKQDTGRVAAMQLLLEHGAALFIV